MRILFDHDVPAPLRRYLVGHHVDTAREKGWERLDNGDLLNQAESDNYEVFVTADQSIRHQQNLRGRKIALLVLLGNFWPSVRHRAEEIGQALDSLQPGEYRELEI